MPTLPDATARFSEAHDEARRIINLDAEIEEAKESLKKLKAFRDLAVSKLVQIAGGARQTTLMDEQDDTQE